MPSGACTDFLQGHTLLCTYFIMRMAAQQLHISLSANDGQFKPVESVLNFRADQDDVDYYLPCPTGWTAGSRMPHTPSDPPTQAHV